MIFVSETRPLLGDVGLKFERAEIQMIRRMCGVSIKDRKTSEELIKLDGVESISTVIISGRLRWYGHVMKKNYGSLGEECMDIRVECGRPVRRPRKT